MIRPARTRAVFTRKAGFTLIELLVVMAILGLLLAIALPRYFGAIDKSKEVVLKEDLQVLRTTIDKFYRDRGHYPETLSDLVEQKYLRAVPVDPITEAVDSWVLLAPQDADGRGVAEVKSGAQGKTADGVPYDQL